MIDRKNRDSSRKVRPTQARRAATARRRGQALLMAVLLMIFAALLGSTFITVVALNLNHAGRQQDMGNADTATRAGLLVTNQSLTNSAAGEAWRPEMGSPPPAPGDSDYTLYYTPLERAQGWARTTPKASTSDSNGGDWDGDGVFDPIKDDWAKLNYDKQHGILGTPPIPARVFVKFPDPRQQPANSSTPTYLVEVKYLPTMLDSLNTVDMSESADKWGKLRITVIGEANDNPNVFTRRISYKSTSASGGPMSYAYYVSNWDNANNRLISTQLTSTAIIKKNNVTPNTSVLAVQNASGMSRGRLLIVHDLSGSATPNPDTVVTVQSVAGSNVTVVSTVGTTYTFSKALVQAASPLMQNLLGTNKTGGSPALFDADGDGLKDTQPYESTSLDAFQANLPNTNAQTVSSGMFFNASLVPQQQSLLNLNSSGVTPSLLQVDGLIKTSTDPVVLPQQQVSDNGTVQSLTAAAASSTSPVKYNPNPQNSDLGGTGPGTNQVKPMTPPKVDGQRYLQLTKYADVANGSAYGYGSGTTPTGVYIDNANDFEKVATTTGYRALSIADDQRFWERKSFPRITGDATPNVAANVYAGNTVSSDPLGRYRLAYASHAIAPHPDAYIYPSGAGSLEEQGLRGWVSPYDFKPRGVMIQLDSATNTVTITRDQNSDSSPSVADPNQAWKTTTGVPVTGAYKMVIYFTTGKRVITDLSGATTYATYTVPFNGVIYAEGNIRIRGALGTLSKSLTVVSMGNIYVEGELDEGGINAQRAYIALLAKKNVVLNPTQFFIQTVDDFSTVTPSATPASTPARLADGNDTSLFTTAAQRTNERFYNLTGATVRLARNIHFDVPAIDTTKDNICLAIQHSGQLKRGADLTFNPTPNAPVMNVAAKNPGTGDTAIDSSEKHVKATIQSGSDTAPNSSQFDVDLLNVNATPTPATEADDTINTLTTMQQQPPFKDTQDMPGGTPTPAPWKIVAQDDGGHDTSSLPVRRLAQLSNPSGLPWNSGEQKHLVITTSVGVYWNPGNATTLDLTQPPGIGLGFTIGSSFRFMPSATPYPSADPRYIEDLAGSQVSPTPSALLPANQSTVNETFYWNRNSQQQASMRWSSYRLNDGNSGTPAPPVVGDNLVVFSRDPKEFDPNVNVPILPAYRIGNFKLERAAFGQLPWSSGLFANNTGNGLGVTSPEQALVVKVEASIFAQEGSWFVIPPPLSPLVDTLGNGNLSDVTNLAAATHYRRPNYQVFVQGNIAQNYVPTGEDDVDIAKDYTTATPQPDPEQDPDGHTGGAMAAWIDAMAYPTDIMGTGLTTDGEAWRSIAYLAAPLPYNSGLYLPVSPDLALTG